MGPHKISCEGQFFLYTPLLPAVATGTVEERSIVEPIRRVVNGKVSLLFASSKRDAYRVSCQVLYG
jgi:NADH dehydrogenase FAD-containing subunit